MVNDPVLKLARSRPRPLSFKTEKAFAEYLRDPRPEFKEDSALWQTLLTRAAAKNPQIHAALHCLRCGGAKIGYQDSHLKFQPRCIDRNHDPQRGTAWENYEDFKLDCEDLLGEYRSTIAELLQTVESQSQKKRTKAEV